MTKPALRIAVIEDDEDIHELLKAFFRPKGYEVHAFTEAETLLKEIQKEGCHYDVILSDLNLPEVSGIEFTKRAKELGVTAPIILITAQQSAEVAAQAIQAGAYDFVVKPIHFPQLLVSVERAQYLRQIQSENEVLKTAVSTKEQGNLDGIIAKSPSFLRAIDLAKRVANSMANIFISGETGAGKEVIARAIHNYSSRRSAPFVAINCSAIPETLLESELFGHAKGAFTGASDKKVGLFEEAQGGTLFLDEIGDLSLPLQAKLLRVLQERKIRRIGENQFRDIDLRVISATHKNLQSEIKEGRFREDLFFRLNVIPIHLPPLRQRTEDILPLANFFLKKFSLINGKKISGFSKSAVEFLLKQPWKGNVRELENVVERAVVLCTSNEVNAEDLFLNVDSEPLAEAAPGVESLLSGPDIKPLEEITNQYILYALKKNNGVKDKTAKDLGIDRKTLYRRISDLEKEPTSTMPN